jgi:ribonuclease HI
MNYDLELVCDGSGTVHNEPCGYSCKATSSIYKGGTVTHFGGFSAGTNNFAELIPFVHALGYDFSVRPKSFVNNKLKEEAAVLCISDSELTVKQGNRKYHRNANKALWAAIDEYERLGYNLTWHHVLRDTIALQIACDSQSRELRKIIEKYLDK